MSSGSECRTEVESWSTVVLLSRRADPNRVAATRSYSSPPMYRPRLAGLQTTSEVQQDCQRVDNNKQQQYIIRVSRTNPQQHKQRTDDTDKPSVFSPTDAAAGTQAAGLQANTIP